MKTTTIKLYDGPSQLDGAPIIVLLTGLGRSSKNTKTGGMLQTWILRKDIAPHKALKTGQDASVCGKCPLRPSLFVKGDVSDRQCYVKVFQAPLSTWKANKDLPVTAPDVARGIIGGRNLRRGSYGDPAAVPARVWRALEGANGTGYTHQWRDRDLSSHVMASVHSLGERDQAMARGYRTFRIITDVAEVTKGEILCPASKEAGAKTQCAKCNLCNGSKGSTDNRKTIAIVAH
jgi:hypothetical protein